MRLHTICLISVFICRTLLANTTLTYTLPKDGRVSLALYDVEGRMVRTLLTGKPLAKGQHTITWDGLDRYGHALPAGDYAWKLLETEGLRAEFITQVGQNVDPVWEKATGNHQSPNAAAIDATGLYRQGSVNEGGHWGVKTDLNGRTLWVNDRNQADPWMGGGEALTLVNGRLFELMRDGTVYGSDAASGRVFTGSDSQPRPWNLRWEGYQAPAGTSDDARRKRNIAERPHDLAGDRANGLLVAAYPQHDAVVWFDAQDGRQVDKAVGIVGLAGIAVAPDGSVYAIAQGRVVAFSRQDKTPRVVIPADGLQSPWRLAVSPKTGNLFVAENSDLAKGTAVAPVPDLADGKAPDMGAGVKITPGSRQKHHQVKRFTADGQLVKAIGRTAGRGDGAYMPTDFRGLTDIEPDAEGGFVVTEGNHTPPRRTARFAADGRLLREWIGAQHYGVIACPEPDNPRFVWTRANADLPGLLRWEVDYDQKTSRLVEVYQDTFAGNRFFGNNSSHGSTVPTVFQHKGRTYIYNGSMSSLTLCVYDPATKQVRPSNASSGSDSRAVIWNDLNDDGQVSDGEILPINRNVVGGYIDPTDLTLRTTPFGTRSQAGHQATPSRFTAGGTPVYAWGEATKVEPWRENGRAYHPLDCRRAADRSWYGSISDSLSNPNEGVENHGAWYYNSCSAFDRLVKWDKAGKPLWSVGKHSSDDDHEFGTTAMPRGLVGFTHGCIVWGDASDEEAARPSVWTEDGLFVDELLRVPSDSLRKEEYGEENTNEYPTGHLATDPKTGDTYYYALNSTGGSPIYRIKGWEGWHRASGEIRLTAAATHVAKRDGTGLKGEYFKTPDCSGEPVLTRTDKLVFFYWWSNDKNSLPKGIEARSFSVRWTGQVEALTTELYRFVFESYAPWRGEGWGTPGRPRWVKLWIAGNLILDTDAGLYRNTTFGLPQPQGIYAEVPLQAGERYDLRLEAGFATNAVARFCWETPGLDRRAILPEFLHPEPGPKRNLETPRGQRPEVIADFGFEESDGVLSWSKTGGDVFGRLTGTARRVPGRTGRAIELEAKGQFEPALFPIDEELRLPDTDYTVAFWFKTTNQTVRLCEAKRYSSYNNRWSDHIVSLESGKVRFQLQGDRALETSDAFNDGQWHQVITTVGPGGQRLHMNGKLIATGKLARRTKTSNRLGLDLGPGGGTATVATDEFKVLGRSLTTVEISKMAN
ncbi:MAG TPA: PA14 domain-containing protein [Candidatus Paceibacterota bacterium]|nr:PA14 domain-containing protein [Verrucomicrobiota bacterium]HRY50129.1 PA14 domain-containing protein [Candidatus Paceibacterota bacterium]